MCVLKKTKHTKIIFVTKSLTTYYLLPVTTKRPNLFNRYNLTERKLFTIFTFSLQLT